MINQEGNCTAASIGPAGAHRQQPPRAHGIGICAHQIRRRFRCGPLDAAVCGDCALDVGHDPRVLQQHMGRHDQAGHVVVLALTGVPHQWMMRFRQSGAAVEEACREQRSPHEC